MFTKLSSCGVIYYNLVIEKLHFLDTWTVRGLIIPYCKCLLLSPPGSMLKSKVQIYVRVILILVSRGPAQLYAYTGVHRYLAPFIPGIPLKLLFFFKR